MLVLTLGLVAIGVLIYKWMTINNDYFEKLGIPYLKPTFFIGCNYRMYTGKISTPDYFKELYNQFTNTKLYGYFDFRSPTFVIRDPELIKMISIQDFSHFVDRRQVIDEKADPLMGNALISLKGHHWRDMRATLSPIFTGSKIRQMFELISECGIQMARHYMNESNMKTSESESPYEMKSLFSKFSTDVIATCAFGIKVDSFKDPNNEFILTGRRILDFSSLSFFIKFMALRLIPGVLNYFNIHLFNKNDKAYFYNIIIDAIKSRKEQNIVRPDLLQLLMQAQTGVLKQTPSDDKAQEGFATVREVSVAESQVKETLTDEQVVAQCLLFFLAGFETISTLLAFTSYELAVNPEVQDRLYEEIVEINSQLKGKSLSYDNLQSMKYMDMVISEALRKWPPGTFTDRLCVKDYVYENDQEIIRIRKGDTIWIPIIGIHHDPQYYPAPDSFDPERFNEENRKIINTLAYMPFGMGPRNCIGSRFALMEVKAVLFYMLLNFRFEVTEKTQIPLKYSMKPMETLPEKGVWLRLQQRNNV